MALPTTPGERPAGDEGLIDHLRTLAASVVAYTGARFQLVGLESKEATAHYLKILIWLGAGLFGLTFGYIFLCIAIVFLVSSGLHISWMWTLFAAGVLHLLLAAIAVAIARSGLTKPMFSATIEEFKGPNMAEHTGTGQKAELIAEIERSRARLAGSFDGLRRDADLGAHFRNSFSTHKAAWLGGAGIAGWVLARLPARKKKVKVLVDKGNDNKNREIKEAAETGVLLGLLKLLFSLFKPAIMAFATKKIAEIATHHNQTKR